MTDAERLARNTDESRCPAFYKGLRCGFAKGHRTAHRGEGFCACHGGHHR